MIDSYPDNKTLSIDSYLPGYKDGLIWGYETIGIAKSDEEMQAHLASLPKGGQDAVGVLGVRLDSGHEHWSYRSKVNLTEFYKTAKFKLHQGLWKKLSIW